MHWSAPGCHCKNYNIWIYTANLARLLHEYEIVYPQLTTKSGFPLNNKLESAVEDERLYLTFWAFGEEFRLDLRKNHKLVDSKFTSGSSDNLHHRQTLSRNCYHIGTVRSSSESSVAISSCHGLVRPDIYHDLFVFIAWTRIVSLLTSLELHQWCPFKICWYLPFQLSRNKRADCVYMTYFRDFFVWLLPRSSLWILICYRYRSCHSQNWSTW